MTKPNQDELLNTAWRTFATGIADAMHEIAVAAICAEEAVSDKPSKSTYKPSYEEPANEEHIRTDHDQRIINAAQWVRSQLIAKRLNHPIWWSIHDKQMLNQLE